MDKLQDTLQKIAPLNAEAMERARARQDDLTKPQGSLGRLEELSIQVAGITGEVINSLDDKVIITMAADHGVAHSGVSAFPAEVTPQMVYNFLRGGAGINVLAAHVGARVVVVDMGVAADFEPMPELVRRKINYGTRDLSEGPAMTREEAVRAVETGIEVFEAELARELNIVGTGDMGIGNTTPSSAITAVVTGLPIETVTGRGTGVDDAGLAHKREIIARALRVNQPRPDDALDILAKVGGYEIGGIAGVILGAAAHRVPVVIDGFISGAGALIAAGLSATATQYMIAAHSSVEIGHRAILKQLGLRPIMDLEMRLGEGTGAALGISVVEAACKVLAQMATFSEAGVTDKPEE
jgi:nicotinate-nucleotide--dimethylbenzimidazole phosphoribosyltransferase